MINKIKNMLLCIKYPFLRRRNMWLGEKLSLDYIWLDDIPEGWRKAFGKKLCIDLKKALKKDKVRKDFRIIDVKEKWGSLRIYTNYTTESVERVLDYYEIISMAYCINCGKPARFVTDGFISYLCDDCYFNCQYERASWSDDQKRIEQLIDNIDNLDEIFKENRLSKNDIPKCDYSDPEMQKMFDAIDWKKLWDLKD